MGKVYIEGGRQVEQALLELSKREALKVGRAAARQAMRPILLAARARVPVREGKLKKALTLTVDRGRNRKFLFATVKVKPIASTKPKGKPTNVYGAFIEYGAPGRNIAPRGYMRAAWDSEGGHTLLGRFGRLLGDGIVKAGERMRMGSRF